MPDKDELPSIDEFGERLKKARPLSPEEQVRAHLDEGQGTALGRGMKIASELLAALLVAGALGYGADQLFGTMPLFLLIGIFLGFAAGMRNVWLALGMDKTEAAESLDAGRKEE
ncbi:MAG: AtpZ/AtpI family protein [Aquisalinus sp.]|nr:AtpZ/AtpI family protein [Aquisalinus sp.]